MDPDRLHEIERLQMQQIMELDMEELQVEEIDESSSSDDDDDFLARDSAVQGENGFTFDTCLASLHTYLGEVDDTHGRLAFLDGGAILNLPMFYLRGAVLFPEATLPLRVILPHSKAAVERALHQVDAPYTIGVTRVHLLSDVGKARFATTGTTAEIRQYRRLDDGSLNVVARGQQRFRLRRCWIDVEGVPCGEIQIVKEDSPLRTPKDAFAQLASVTDFRKCILHPKKLSMFSPVELHKKRRADNDWESASGTSIDSDHSDMDLRISLPGTDSPHKCERIQECSSSDEEFLHGLGQRSNRSLGSSHHTNMGNNYGLDLHVMESSSLETRFDGVRYGAMDGIRRLPRASLSFWPQWAYHMFDSYVLAHRAADLWKKIIRAPNLDDHIGKPDILSFHIGSKLPVSESTRQELLEIDGVSYRLRREIQLLESFNNIRCKVCLALIANRSDLVVMSSDGPLNAYVNPHGYVHEIITVYNANGLALIGSPVKEHSWFPGYAWTITSCARCEKNMGWLFTATKKNLLPKSFWGIRSSQVVDDAQLSSQ